LLRRSYLRVCLAVTTAIAITLISTAPSLAASPAGTWKTDWTRFFVLLVAPFIVMAIYGWLDATGRLSPRCPECRGVLIVETRTKSEPTIEQDGVGVRIRTCPACGYRDEKEFTIARYMATGNRNAYIWLDKDWEAWLRAKVKEPGFGAGPEPKDLQRGGREP